VPALDCAYKLQEYDGLPRRKRSAGKATWPGRKQVWRRYDDAGLMAGDVLTVEGDPQSGEPLVQLVMRGGKRVGSPPALADARARVVTALGRLPAELKAIMPGRRYRVDVAPALFELAAAVDRRLAGRTVPTPGDKSLPAGRDGGPD
jgi:nicotinate phosphoribosyltransferase